MIYTIGGIKGGSGKSTIATNLAVFFAINGKDTLLIDADDQETATDFTNIRNETLEGKAGYTAIQLTNQSLRQQALNLKSKYDEIVIDTGGRDTTSQRAALSITDIFIVPFVPRSFDMWTLEKVINLIDEMKQANPNMKAVAVLNKTDHQGNDNSTAKEFLTDDETVNETLKFINTPLGNRKAFGNAAASGLSVIEITPKDAKAIAEFENLYNVVTNLK